jgi:hypothetical protein
MDQLPKDAKADEIEKLIYRLYEGINHDPLHDATFLEDKKLIACRHEIVIDVTANVMEEDESGEQVGTKEICKQNYRIPVPSNKDYNVFMKAFFNHIESCMGKSYEQASKNN